MYTKVSLFGLLLLQLTVPTTKAFVPLSHTQGGLGLDSVATGKRTSLMMAKKILCSFDSTGNGEILSNPKIRSNYSYTNILRLHVLAGGSLDLEKYTGVEGSDQICLYVNGVGGDSTSPKLWTEINNVLGVLKFQIDSMKSKLEAVYEEGDKIYVTGFSRGSASARQFVANLENNGLQPANGGKKVKKPPIEFLGCFDTVSDQFASKDLKEILIDATLGKITPSDCIGEVDGKLPSIVKKAVHGLSLDDNRFTMSLIGLVEPFPPVFMDSKDERVHEAWFPGVHADVGGGETEHGLSDCAGVYLQEWLEHEGIVFYKPDEIPKENFKIPGQEDNFVTPELIAFKPDPAGMDYINTGHRSKRHARPVATVHDNKIFKEGTVRIHETVLGHLKARNYDINKNIKNVNNANGDLVVIGSLDKVDDEKTKELKELLKKI